MDKSKLLEKFSALEADLNKIRVLLTCEQQVDDDDTSGTTSITRHRNKIAYAEF
jgi:hypothetical protein